MLVVAQLHQQLIKILYSTLTALELFLYLIQELLMYQHQLVRKMLLLRTMSTHLFLESIQTGHI